MDQIATLFHQILHFDKYILGFVENHGVLVYVIMAAIVFLETGLFVLAPLLPSDTLIFASGALAATGYLHLEILIGIFFLAAVSGDSLNYLLGRLLSEWLVSSKLPIINKHRLDQVRKFYYQHGGLTVLYGRFIPLIRTFIPFTAGSGSMAYLRFLKFCCIGVMLWVLLTVLSGYFFSEIPLVKKYPALIFLGLSLMGLLPGIVQLIYHKSRKKRDSLQT
jgi:membrane-associated protein